jgi:TolB protein
MLCFGLLAGLVAAGAAVTAGQAPPARGQTEISLVISADPGAPPSYAVPDFVALSGDAETAAAAKTIAQVLWDDFAFERELDMIPRDTYETIRAARTVDTIPYDRWREIGADGLIFGTVQKVGDRMSVEVRLINVGTRQQAFGQLYEGSAGNPRRFAHEAADAIHEQQRGLRGVARTKLVFSSNRDGARVVGTVQEREVKEIYISDYDGANQQRVTSNRSLNVFPVWTPDGRGILYTSYVRGPAELFLSMIYDGVRLEPTKGHTQGVDGFSPQSRLGMVSPDGKRIVFSSPRDGNPELYVMNLDGSNLFRLTNHPAADITPTWNPQGTQIAFTSDRRGTPQIYIIGADGTNLTSLTSELYADRATWSPMGIEIAYTARTGLGNDIKVIDLATREIRQLTFSSGTNESPAFSPSGRHLAFQSTRAGRMQIFTMARDGRDIRQITRTGDNQTPNWSQ